MVLLGYGNKYDIVTTYDKYLLVATCATKKCAQISERVLSQKRSSTFLEDCNRAYADSEYVRI